jgi:hypothetical protein
LKPLRSPTFSAAAISPRTLTDDQDGYLIDFENMATSGWYGPCYYPAKGEGFNVCEAGAVSGDTALFSAAADSFCKLHKIELWVDGVKVDEQHDAWDTHAYFDWSGTSSPGTHQATFFAADVDNALQRYDFTYLISARMRSNLSSMSETTPAKWRSPVRRFLRH